MVEDRGSYCILEKRESDERMVGDKSNRYKPKCKCEGSVSVSVSYGHVLLDF